jgi:hypothetical protein
MERGMSKLTDLIDRYIASGEALLHRLNHGIDARPAFALHRRVDIAMTCRTVGWAAAGRDAASERWSRQAGGRRSLSSTRANRPARGGSAAQRSRQLDFISELTPTPAPDRKSR